MFIHGENGPIAFSFLDENFLTSSIAYISRENIPNNVFDNPAEIAPWLGLPPIPKGSTIRIVVGHKLDGTLIRETYTVPEQEVGFRPPHKEPVTVTDRMANSASFLQKEIPVEQSDGHTRVINAEEIIGRLPLRHFQ